MWGKVLHNSHYDSPAGCPTSTVCSYFCAVLDRPLIPAALDTDVLACNYIQASASLVAALFAPLQGAVVVSAVPAMWRAAFPGAFGLEIGLIATLLCVPLFAGMITADLSRVLL